MRDHELYNEGRSQRNEGDDLDSDRRMSKRNDGDDFYTGRRSQRIYGNDFDSGIQRS